MWFYKQRKWFKVGTFCVSAHGSNWCLYLESVFFVPQAPVQSVLLQLHNVNRKDDHHLTTLLVKSSAAAVSSSLLGCYISFIEKQNNISVKWLVKGLFIAKKCDVMLTQGMHDTLYCLQRRLRCLLTLCTWCLAPWETVSFVSRDPQCYTMENKTHRFLHGQSIKVLSYFLIQKKTKKCK